MSSVTTQGYRISPEQGRLWLLQRESSAYLTQAAIKIDGAVDVPALETCDRGSCRSLRNTANDVPPSVRNANPPAGDRRCEQILVAKGRLERPESSRRSDASLDELLASRRTRALDLEPGHCWRCASPTARRKRALPDSQPALVVRGCSVSDDSVRQKWSSVRRRSSPATRRSQPLQYADFAEWHCQLLDEDEESPAKAYWREQRLSASSLSSAGRAPRSEPHGRFEVAATALPIDPADGVGSSGPGSPEGRAGFRLLSGLLADPGVATVRPDRRGDGAVADERGGDTLRDACGLFSHDAARSSVASTTAHGSRRSSTRSRGRGEPRRTGSTTSPGSGTIEGAGSTCEPGFLPSGLSVSHAAARAGTRERCRSRSHGASPARIAFNVKLTCACRTAMRSAIEWHFDSNVLPAEEVERLSRHYTALVKSAVEQPAGRGSRLEVLDEAQRQEIVVGFNGSKSRLTRPSVVFTSGSRQSRGGTRIGPLSSTKTRSLTYGELNARCNQLGALPEVAGRRPRRAGRAVCRASLDMIVGMLGILKAGGAYVPLDPHPAEPAAGAADRRVPLAGGGLPAASCGAVFGECMRSWSFWARTRAAELSEESRPKTASSGVTLGEPGLHVVHVRLDRHAEGRSGRAQAAASTTFTASSSDCSCRASVSFATVSSYAADLGNTAIFPALLSGGCLHIVSQDRVMDPAAMAEYGERHGVDCLKIVPSHLTALLSSPRPERVLPRRRLVLGGEASTWDLVEPSRGAVAGLPDHEPLRPDGSDRRRAGVSPPARASARRRKRDASARPPVSNSQVYLLDSRMRPVPIGVSGELHIGGRRSRARLRESPRRRQPTGFVPNPCGTDPGARMYRTGDLARYLADGNIEFLGRADHQVKIRGFRVELGEIESVSETTRVRSKRRSCWPARMFRATSAWSAYAVRRRDAQVTTEELRDYVRGAAARVHGARRDRLAGPAAAESQRESGPRRLAGRRPSHGSRANGPPCRRGRRTKKCCWRSGPRCWGTGCWGWTTISSSPAATRFWPCS